MSIAREAVLTGVPIIFVFGLVLILLEDLTDLGDIGVGGSRAKEQRRLELERAIVRREAPLAEMDGRRP